MQRIAQQRGDGREVGVGQLDSGQPSSPSPASRRATLEISPARRNPGGVFFCAAAGVTLMLYAM
jgi:hypothetical protein